MPRAYGQRCAGATIGFGGERDKLTSGLHAWGIFADLVRTRSRKNRLAHPFDRRFDRDAWHGAETTDNADRELQSAGAAIADLIAALRPHATTAVRSTDLTTALVAMANVSLRALHAEFESGIGAELEAGVQLEDVLNHKHAPTGGTLFELTDAIGDSAVFPLRQTLNTTVERRIGPSKKAWCDAVEQAHMHSVLSNKWFLLWTFWMDVLWRNARFVAVSPTCFELLAHEKTGLIDHIGIIRRQRKIESLLAILNFLHSLNMPAGTHASGTSTSA